MALIKTIRRWPSRLLFLVRFLGLTGLLVVVVGGFLIYFMKDSTPALGALANGRSPPASCAGSTDPDFRDRPGVGRH